MADKNKSDNNASSDNTFDNITRILASTMPRRQALKLALTMTASAVAASLFADSAVAAPKRLPRIGRKKTVLDLPITNFSLKGVQIYNVINTLGQQYQVPVSFIDASDKTEGSQFDPKNPYAPLQAIAVGQPAFTIDIKSGTVRDVLNQLVKQDPSYQYGMVSGRLVVYPNQAKFKTIVSGVNIRNEPRGDATVDYVFETLGKHVKGFEDYGTVIGRWGEPPDAPIYMEPVTLSPQGTVLEQMVELLGSNPQLVFSVVKNPTPTGSFLFHFGTVGPQSPSVPSKGVVPHPLTNHNQNQQDTTMSGGTPSASSNQVCRPTNLVYGQRKSSTSCSRGCGVTDVYTVTGLTLCTGDDCTGRNESEQAVQQATNSGGIPVCQLPDPNSPPLHLGCGEIYDYNSFTYFDVYGKQGGCMDTYIGPCFTDPLYSQPGYMCQDTFTQTVSVDGSPVNPFAVATITFTRTVDSKGHCKATVSPPSFSSLVTCCGTGKTGSPKTLCDNSMKVCLENDICCPLGDDAHCNHVCCRPSSVDYDGEACANDPTTGLPICCLLTQICGGGTIKICCPDGQICSDDICCPKGQTNYSGICCPTGNTNCGGKCCASGICCNGTCCDAGQTCAGGMCCNAPTPQARMSHAQVLQGRYATDDLSQCCQPGQVPCGNACCDKGSICCSGSCCAGTCDDTGACITNGENK